MSPSNVESKTKVLDNPGHNTRLFYSKKRAFKKHKAQNAKQLRNM